MKNNLWLGFVLLCFAVAIGFVSFYAGQFTAPKQTLVLTDSQKWVVAHPAETKWTIDRYNRFQKAAADAFLQNDVANVTSK